ncbi:MAG: solute-binding protein [Gemmatimonadetes bacterium]|uniref:Solute-binding protein n=1 Tax=Candidatus Kutchimonas denitrificans TaxID=3056748 RepID=A0AAE4Z8T1_9BACT|nr:solute-binding protein [Gemmatimonadota bacterium]NIR75118.1 solute-binding protein [Candidatus Kutchimonas denitrificans]NIS00950.1 solute-binding protein [Gemmatimonadota bacterium]NIT66567.1 solute-binding protein [Gemmatimonadota bacterium]NIU52913.1 solute-binding protein [Gemmatimonadota bacterium]
MVLGLATMLGLLFIGCSTEPREIILASTTSTEDSGLFERLLPAFREAHPGYRVRVIAVGSGEALRLAARGDADAVLAHSPGAEEEFMAAGHGESRQPVMYNDFVIVGPPAGSARHCALESAAAALACIAADSATFISRGDDSGTHARERRLWDLAGIEADGEWYLEAGQGMGAVLMMASEMDAYTLTDRGTYLSLRERLHLSVLVEGDPILRNQYSVIVVRDAAELEGARTFADWITSEPAQSLIGAFGTERFGRRLFTPNAGQTSQELKIEN